ncbi:hypothetical protein EOE18_17690 [Novosphingobium umbonatum]|uniref:Uncharacterized protein n=1 Tax=Novosphingobium umbonatum TaxID=1908524 RepID=A0A437MX11_9SPHN|nr:hypothetical protein [Novosphingobium umbonatum]RVU02202.1 hypothetical protein EOE18_17690 [Novosphingobium umbonatum]
MPPESPFLEALQGANFSFTARPEPVAGDLRMSWGIGVVLLSLLHSRGKKASFLKLQFLAHSIRTEGSREQVNAVLRGERKTSDVQVRVEPWLNRAVAFAHGLKYVTVNKGKTISLTPLGQNVASAIDVNSEVLQRERAFLTIVAKRATEDIVTRIWRMESLL